MAESGGLVLSVAVARDGLGWQELWSLELVDFISTRQSRRLHSSLVLWGSGAAGAKKSGSPRRTLGNSLASATYQ